MKKHYWFVGLFGLWCLLSALWYFLDVKGIKTDPSVFNPHNSLIAIIEILVMLLVACLLGYAIAWWLRAETIEVQDEKLDSLQAEKEIWNSTHDELKNQIELWNVKHKSDVIASQSRVSELSAEKERMQRRITDLESQLSEAKKEAIETKSKSQPVDPEASTLRYRVRQLEFQIKEKEEVILRLNSELEMAHLRKEKSSVSDHPFVRPLEPDEKDDLTKIKGIGPFIEKRLNMIGIYTFQQLAELSPEMIDRVGAAIEFFPHRIIRDDWVGQANRFSQR